MPESKQRVRVGSTASNAEMVDRLPIARASEPGKPRSVVMSLGPTSDTDLPMPDLQPGDRLRVFAEVELTTDAPTPNHPGLIGAAYTYAPELEAKLLLAKDSTQSEPAPGKALALGTLWRGNCTHKRHHLVVSFADVQFDVPRRGLPWSGASWVNLTVAASHPKAGAKDVILVGENEKEPVVDQDVSGIRVIRYRPGPHFGATERQADLRSTSVPVAKKELVAISMKMEGLRKGDQLFAKGRLVTDSRRLGYPARISSRLFLASEPADTEPKGRAQEMSSWKGHLSKESSTNCLPDEGPKVSEKFGVLRVLRDQGTKPVFINLVALSAAPFNNPTVNADHLPIVDGHIEVVRFPAEVGN